MIRADNKSGFCCGCGPNENRKKRFMKKCFICGDKCSGKLQIVVRKGSQNSFCTRHFNQLLNPEFNDPKKLRVEVKRLQGFH